jgi:hypothetical protein
MASGLIYLIILGMWGAYFLPRWISQHDHTSGRATERYKSAMKVVASTPNIPDAIDPEKKLRALRKRQSITTTLISLTVITALASIGGVISPVGVLLPITATAIYFIHIRRQVVAAQLKKRRLQALARITTADIKIDPTVRISLSPRAYPVPAESTEHWIPLAERNESSTITIIPRDGLTPSSPAAPSTWSPIAVPRPTYTTAPKAIRSQRTIDLTVPGAWSAEQERLAALEVPARDELFDQELAEQAAIARDKAANE